MRFLEETKKKKFDPSKKLRVLGALFLGFLFSGNFIQTVCHLDINELPFPTCFFHKITGIPCPGCGMTKAFLSLGHFELREAFSYNPFSFLLMAFLILFILSPRLIKPLEKKEFLTALLMLVLVYWIKKIASFV